MGTFAVDSQFNAAEELSIALLCRLSKSPKKIRHPALEAGSGLETFQASLRAWKGGGYLRLPRSRGRDIALSPTYFSENARHKTPTRRFRHQPIRALARERASARYEGFFDRAGRSAYFTVLGSLSTTTSAQQYRSRHATRAKDHPGVFC